MLIYLGAFAVSVGIAAYGEHLRTKKNNEKGFYLCLALAVLVMAVLAGLRDPSIGTDSVVYEGWARRSDDASDRRPRCRPPYGRMGHPNGD